ncbi:MAG: HAD-IIB family hydrolase [Phycisphaerae bacterium]
MAATHLLVSDLDNTLLGDDAGLDRFADWVRARTGSIRVVYASGRFFASVSASIRATALPAPDAVIGGVGTDIHDYPSGKLFTEWHDRIGREWSAARVRDALAADARLRPQPEEFQSAFKVSYYRDGASAEDLAVLRRRLGEAGLDAAVIYSSDRDLDILPHVADKGTAAAFLAGRWGVSSDRVLVCGDSGNDLSLFRQGFRGVVVANAHAELKRLEGPRVYQARQAFAAGVVEGLEHWLSGVGAHAPDR